MSDRDDDLFILRNYPGLMEHLATLYDTARPTSYMGMDSPWGSFNTTEAEVGDLTRRTGSASFPLVSEENFRLTALANMFQERNPRNELTGKMFGATAKVGLFDAMMGYESGRFSQPIPEEGTEIVNRYGNNFYGAGVNFPGGRLGFSQYVGGRPTYEGYYSTPFAGGKLGLLLSRRYGDTNARVGFERDF